LRNSNSRARTPVRSKPPASSAVRSALAPFLVLATLFAPLAGCDLDFNPGNGGGGGGGDMNTNGTDGEPQPVPGETLFIRFANLTDEAVLADVFVSTNGSDLTPETLFVPANQLVDGVGLASTGVLVPQSSDTVEVACEPGTVVGTSGGVFRDPDSGADLGVGASRILQEGLVFDCGAEITFVYRLEDDGYTVVVTLE
jgi:hypothetical protein